jgi:hypothetical protein
VRKEPDKEKEMRKRVGNGKKENERKRKRKKGDQSDWRFQENEQNGREDPFQNWTPSSRRRQRRGRTSKGEEKKGKGWERGKRKMEQMKKKTKRKTKRKTKQRKRKGK